MKLHERILMKLVRLTVLSVALSLSAVCLLSLPAGIFLHRSSAAPAPFPKIHARSTEPPVGLYDATWGQHKATMRFDRWGNYSCGWFSQTYTGSWSYEAGRLTIIESNTPDNPNSWRTYTFERIPDTRMWKCTSGAIGVVLTLNVAEEWSSRQTNNMAPSR